MPLGKADLVVLAAGPDDAARVLRRLGEGPHAVGHPPDRPDHHAVDGEEDETRRDQRDDQRQDQDVARIDQHRAAQRAVLEHHVEHHGAVADGAVDPDRPVAAEDELVEGGDDGRSRIDRGEVVARGRSARHVPGRGDQARRAVLAQRDRLGAGRHQRFLLELFRQLDVLQPVDDDAGAGGLVQLVLEPAHPHVGDGRHEDEHFGDHHEEHGQEQKLARQAVARRSSNVAIALPRPASSLVIASCGPPRCVLPQPKRARTRTSRRTDGLRVTGA